MTNSTKKPQKSQITKQNVLESLKDLGTGTFDQMGDFAKNTSEDFFKELMGIKSASRKASGNLEPGSTMKFSEAMSGKYEENQKLKQQISFERNLSAQEKSITEKKVMELRVQLQAITQEIGAIAKSSVLLAQESKIAMIQAPVNPGVYHLVFFENVLEFLKSFRKKIQNASIWMGASNKRAQKKNYWSMYKKKGSSFLLSPDHYLQRSAG